MSMRRVIGWCALLWGLFSLTACEVKRPKEVLSDEQMEQVLVDYHVARAMGEVLAMGENYKTALYVEDVFRKHGITQADFDTTMAWMARNPKHLTEIYTQVNKRMRARRDGINALVAMNDEKPMDTAPGDSVDVWMWQQHYALTGTPLNNKIAFNLPSDTNFKARDILSWSIRFRYEGNGTPDTLHLPLMAMQIAYDSDSIISTWQQIDRAGVRTLTLSADTLGGIREVRGFVYYPKQATAATLLADRISLMRYHANDSLFAGADTLQGEKKPSPANRPPRRPKAVGGLKVAPELQVEPAS